MHWWNKKLTWRRLFILIISTFFWGKLFARWAYPNYISMSEVWVAIACLIILKFTAELPGGLRRFHQARVAGVALATQLAALLPPELPGLIRLDRELRRGFFAWLRRRPIICISLPGQTIDYHRKSQYSTIFAIVLLVCMTEIPFSGLMIGIVEHDPARRLRIHMGLCVISAYTLIWLIGDRQLLKSTFHSLSTDHLYLRIGARFHADIPLDRISNVSCPNEPKRLSESARQWHRRAGLSPEETMTVSPLDSPNVIITLEDFAAVDVEIFKVKRPAARHLLVYIDNPADLLHISKHVSTKRI